jgi:hypothetical protein
VVLALGIGAKNEKSEGATRAIVGWLQFSHGRRRGATAKADLAAGRTAVAWPKYLIRNLIHLDSGLTPD